MNSKTYSPKIFLPLPDKPIKFFVKKEEFQGTFIPKEKMFFIGFGDCGDFKYIWEVDSWCYIENEVPEICIKKCDKFPDCQPCGDWFSKM